MGAGRLALVGCGVAAEGGDEDGGRKSDAERNQERKIQRDNLLLKENIVAITASTSRGPLAGEDGGFGGCCGGVKKPA